MGVTEELILARRAARAIRRADRRLLFIGSILTLGGGQIVVWPEVNQRLGGGEPAFAVWFAATIIGGAVGAIGVSLLRAAFGRFDAEGHTQTWFVVVTAIPYLGSLIRWLVLRSEREVYDPGEG